MALVQRFAVGEAGHVQEPGVGLPQLVYCYVAAFGPQVRDG